MQGHVFVAPGDLTQLGADAIAFSASNTLSSKGNLYSAFEANVPGFAAWYDQLRRGQALPLEVGSTFWRPLNADRRPYGMVVVVATGQSAVEDKAGLAVRAALSMAVQRLREQRRGGRLLVALPAFRVGQGGDRRQRLRSARAQLAAAVEALEGLPEVDAAFVTYTPTLYQIFLEARRELLGGPPAADVAPPAALEQALRARECVVFVGAGLSSGAGLPDWSELVRRLAADLGVQPQPRLDYLDLAQWYREQFGPSRLAQVVRETFGAQGLPTLAHYLLMGLPVRHVITTNYDDLLERALAGLKQHPVRVLRQEDVAHTGRAGTYVVKLHGDASHPEDIVISRDDYDEFFQRRPATALLLEGLLLNQAFFFVGYGLRDPNFRQLYSRIARMLRQARRPAFATTFEAGADTGEHLRRQWRHKHLHLVPIAGASLADQEQQLLRFLDRLADQVTMSRPRLFLARDVEAGPALGPLRGALIERVGAELEALGRGGLGAATGATEAHYLAQVLEFLSAHGWRPASGPNLCRLWEQLAERAGDAAERRRLLIEALASAEAFADARRVRGRLAELENADRPSPGERHENA
jgi:hypothetical protein